MELKYIVYVTVNLVNGKLYFGVHETNPEVFDGYIGNGVYNDKGATQDFPFHKAVRKYGYKNFKRTTIAVFDYNEEGKKAAFALEAEIVNPTLLKSRNVYNIALSGGVSISADKCNKVYQYSLDGNFIRSYKSVRYAARCIRPDNVESAKNMILKVCNEMQYSAYGYYWSYCKEFVTKEDYLSVRLTRKNPIAQYTLSGKFLRQWKDLKTVKAAFNNCSGIQQCCTGFCQSSCGYQWRYYTDDTDIKPVFNDKIQHDYTPIIMIDGNGNETEYSSIKDCLKNNPQFTAKGIGSAILGHHQKSHRGYKFKWKDENIV